MGTRENIDKSGNNLNKDYDHNSSLESDKLMIEIGLENGELAVEIQDERQKRLLYRASDHPPIYLTIFCGFQVIIFNSHLIVTVHERMTPYNYSIVKYNTI